MGLESTMICVDNSEFMRNGDYLPTRLQAQQVENQIDSQKDRKLKRQKIKKIEN